MVEMAKHRGPDKRRKLQKASCARVASSMTLALRAGVTEAHNAHTPVVSLLCAAPLVDTLNTLCYAIGTVPAPNLTVCA